MSESCFNTLGTLIIICESWNAVHAARLITLFHQTPPLRTRFLPRAISSAHCPAVLLREQNPQLAAEGVWAHEGAIEAGGILLATPQTAEVGGAHAICIRGWGRGCRAALGDIWDDLHRPTST